MLGDAFSRKHIPGAVDDLVLMEKLNQAPQNEIVRILHSRLDHRVIYTYISNVLICVNPFTRLPLYTDDWINAFRTRHMNDLPPHIFSIAESTYRAMVQEEEDQCIIISGESGAGKTEASKQVMQYIAAVSGDTPGMRRVKLIMLESNPLLEAFGNAKTVRNDNSSRFGKFFEIYFDMAGGPIGGKISNFLLEKSRVVGQQRGERNFHIFYQLTCECARGTFPSLKLTGGPSAYRYLTLGNTLTVDGIDDIAEFAATSNAFAAMGIDAAAQQHVWELLAAVLHIGNLSFKESGSSCVVADPAALAHVASLLGGDAAKIERSITWRAFDSGREVVQIPLELTQCDEQRDALAKAIYDKVFDYVVETVNAAFGELGARSRLMIGVLDIYGFEIFERNSFEQFCINYVNEKLQQIFIELTLKVEQEEYVKEQIKWDPIKYFDNKTVVDLIEGKSPPGIFRVIDDACATMAKEDPRHVDAKMMDKVATHCGGHKHFHRTEWGFRVQHYAGYVEYNRMGFVMKNRDSLTSDLMEAVVVCTHPLMGRLFALERDIVEDERLAKEAEKAGAGGFGARGGAKKRVTLGMKIMEQANRLVTVLKSCTPHYIRCVKPNDTKTPLGFVDDRVAHQVQYLGLVENIRVRRAGFAYRQFFDKFLKRFKYLSPACYPRPFKGSDKDGCRAIFAAVEGMVEGTSFQFGTTKVFLRRPEDLFRLEELRSSKFDGMAAQIQRAYRSYKKRVVFVKLRAAIEKFITKNGKQRRAGSVIRPFVGNYYNFHAAPLGIKNILRFRDPIDRAWQPVVDPSSGRTYYWNHINGETAWAMPPTPPDNPEFDYSDVVDRVTSHRDGVLTQQVMLIDREYITMLETVRTETIIKGSVGKPARGKTPAVPAVPDQVIVNVHYMLRTRLKIAHIRALSLSKLADTYLIIHTYDVPPSNPPPLTPTAGWEGCSQQCGAIFIKPNPKLLPKGAPRPVVVPAENCYRCGGVFCGNCACYSQAMPGLGYQLPVRVCAHCFGKTPTDPCEDIVLSTEKKTEIVAVLKQRARLAGADLAVAFEDSIAYNNRSEAAPPPRPVAKVARKPTSKRAGAAAAPEPVAPPAAVTPVVKTISFQYDQNPHAPTSTLYASPPHALIVTTGYGVDTAVMQRIEAAREARRVAARERYLKEQAEEREREAAKDGEREAERRKAVEARKAERAADLDKARLEEEAKEAARSLRDAKRADVQARAAAAAAAAGTQAGWQR